MFSGYPKWLWTGDVGGKREGTHIPRLFRENITENKILAILDNWIADWLKNRLVNEGVGDSHEYCATCV